MDRSGRGLFKVPSQYLHGETDETQKKTFFSQDRRESKPGPSEYDKGCYPLNSDSRYQVHFD